MENITSKEITANLDVFHRIPQAAIGPGRGKVEKESLNIYKQTTYNHTVDRRFVEKN